MLIMSQKQLPDTQVGPKNLPVDLKITDVDYVVDAIRDSFSYQHRQPMIVSGISGSMRDVAKQLASSMPGDTVVMDFQDFVDLSQKKTMFLENNKAEQTIEGKNVILCDYTNERRKGNFLMQLFKPIEYDALAALSILRSHRMRDIAPHSPARHIILSGPDFKYTDFPFDKVRETGSLYFDCLHFDKQSKLEKYLPPTWVNSGVT